MVFVDILRIATVMHAVVRRRIEEEFKPCGEFIDPFGVNPKLIERIESAKKEEPFITKAQNGQRKKERRGKNLLQRPLSQGYAQIVIFTLVVYHMANPEEVYLMAHAMGPVVGEVDADEEQDQPRPRGRQGEQAKLLVNVAVERYGKHLDEQPSQLLYYSAANIGKSIAQTVDRLFLPPRPSPFDADQEKENGDA